MIIDKTLNVLHFEDNKVTQSMMRKLLKKQFHAKVKTESTLYNLDLYLKTHIIDDFDLIICDVMFAGDSALNKVKQLAECGKFVIFNSCIEEDDFYCSVWDKLGDIPTNFVFIRKADKLGLEPLITAIRNRIR